MAGLVPAIHVLAIEKKVVDARVKPGHDEPVQNRRAFQGPRSSAAISRTERIADIPSAPGCGSAKAPCRSRSSDRSPCGSCRTPAFSWWWSACSRSWSVTPLARAKPRVPAKQPVPARLAQAQPPGPDPIRSPARSGQVRRLRAGTGKRRALQCEKVYSFQKLRLLIRPSGTTRSLAYTIFAPREQRHTRSSRSKQLKTSQNIRDVPNPKPRPETARSPRS